MKKYFWILLCLLTLMSCQDALDQISDSVLPQEELIKLGNDTFHVAAENVFADYIYSLSDSFLLGNYQDKEFGNTRAEILAQFASPEGYTFPEGSVLDSMCLYVYFNSLYGYAYTALQIKAYEMDKKTFRYSERYPSNIKPEDYCSQKKLLADYWLSPAHPTDSIYNETAKKYIYYARIPLDTAFARYFFNEAPNHFRSQEEFCDFFKGIYLTTDFGTEAMLYVTQIDMGVFFHHTYTSVDIDGNTYSKTSYESRTFPANSEVRQVNVFSHSDREQVKARLDAIDSLCYIASPANIYAQLAIPTAQMVTKIGNSMGWKKRCYVNGAELKVDLVDVDTTAMSTAPKYMLLIKRDAMDNWFKFHEDLADTCAILGTLAYSTDSSATNVTGYYYSFQMSGFLNQQLRLIDAANASKPTAEAVKAFYLGKETTPWVLVPVELETGTTSGGSSTLMSIRHLYSMSSTRIRNGHNPAHPLRLTLVWTGY